jgi:hypothetical protein
MMNGVPFKEMARAFENAGIENATSLIITENKTSYLTHAKKLFQNRVEKFEKK